MIRARNALSVAAALSAVLLLAPGAALANSPPVIESEGVSNVTGTDATLEAKINTEGASPEGGVWYQFQLVINPSEYHAEFACPPEFPEPICVGPKESDPEGLPIKRLPQASGGQAVSQDVATAGRTLATGTTYHFRVIAANRVVTLDTIQWEPPIVYGPDQTFTTTGPAAPIVTSVEPKHGPAAGGTSVTITGSGLSEATSVKFGSNNAASFTVNSATSITAVSPAGSGAVDVTVTTPVGTSATRPADQFTYGPTVTKVEPNIGSAAGGTSVTITGTGFSGATAVKFGSTNATSVMVNSASSITAVSPAGTGAVDVTVTTPAGTSPTSPADLFTYGPTVTKVEPNRGSPGGGTTVTITGTGFTGATAVSFGATGATSFTVNSETSITAVSPRIKKGGTVDVTVTTPAGTSPTSAADQFTFSRK